MFDHATLVTLLGLEARSKTEQDEAIDEFHIVLGEELMKNLDETQLAEYERIINGDDPFILEWLAAHRSGYQDSEEYQPFFESAQHDNDEHVSPEKMYASAAWLEENHNDVPGAIQRAAQRFKNHTS